MQLVLHPTTGYQYEALKNTAPHAILITGEEGSGKAKLATTLVGDLLNVDIHNYPYILEITSDKQSIGIDSIRQLRDFLGRKTTGSDALRRAVIVQNGHLMTGEAQNALLKHLEEPPEDTVIVITASDITKLLPTIRSRVQQIHVAPVSFEQVKTHHKNIDGTKLSTMYYMSDGRMGLMSALLNDDASHPLVAAITEAKSILRMDTYERLARVDELSKQKDALPLLLTGMQRVLASGLKQAAAKQNHAQTKAFYNLTRAVYHAQMALHRNVNTKLLLTDLFLRLG